jgi:hypothetical protein
MRSSKSSARSPWPCVASQRGDSGSEKRNTKTINAQMPMTIQQPRQPSESRNVSANNVVIGQTNAPPINCTPAMKRPRMAFGAYSPA